MKAVCFMVCTWVQKNTSDYAFCHSAFLKWLTPERLASRIKVRVCLCGGYSLCRDKLTFMPMDSYETQASRIHIFVMEGLRKPYNYCLQDWEKNFLFFICICLLLSLSVIQLALRAGRRVILTIFFMLDIWPHQWESLSGSRVGELHILHVHASMDDDSRSNILFRAWETCARSALKLCHVTISKKMYFTVAKIVLLGFSKAFVETLGICLS